MAESQFPVNVDNIKRIQDFPQSQAANVARYNVLKSKVSLTNQEQTELQNLKITLEDYLITADMFNTIANAVEATQKFTKDNVDDYFQEKQNDINIHIQQKQNEIQSTLNSFSGRDQYNNGTTYQKWNIVTYNYETYMSKHENNLGNTPVGNISDTHWMKIAHRGAQGVPGIGLVFVGDYNNATTYQPQQAVNSEGTIYYCTAPTTGNTPSKVSNYWTVFMESNSVYISNTPPPNPAANPFWIDTSV